jgi:hypothetical protein
MNNTKIRNKKEIGESILRGLNEAKDNSESLRAIQNYEFRNQNEKQKDIPAISFAEQRTFPFKNIKE